MRLDDSYWPLIIATASPEFDLAAVEALRTGFDAVFRRREAYAVIIDTRPVKAMPDAKCRKALGEWLRDPAVNAATVQFNVGAATIVSSEVQRLTLTAVGWVWKSPSPQTAVRTMREAIEFCCDKLERAGVPLGGPLRELRQSLSKVA
jgi:hypothetical protein